MTMPTNNTLWLDEATSTNTLLLDLARSDSQIPQLYSIVALDQKAGRGQRGNTWCVSPGKNLTFSFLLGPQSLRASEQFALSELASYAVLLLLRHYIDTQQGEYLSIKWPNDIYYRDSKIAGILIEHSITGGDLDYSVVGIGLNINEDAFPTSLPNPISLKQITSRDYDIAEVHTRLMGYVSELLPYLSPNGRVALHERYKSCLYRRDGFYMYRDVEGVFEAELRDVLPSGLLLLRGLDGIERIYAFKEVSYLLPSLY